MSPAPDILVVGNCCHDTLVHRDGRAHRVLGGSAAYVSAILTALGAGFRTVSKVGSDFHYAEQLPFSPIVEGARSTSFIDDYRSGERRETLEAAGPRIHPGDLDGRYKLAIACAVAGEISPETLLAMRGRAELVLADAQGLVRAFGPRGEVTVQPLAKSAFSREALGAIDWLKVGANELPCVDETSLRAKLLFTDGPRGCTLRGAPDSSGARAELQVPPFPAEERDATGAGDCFLAGFAWGLLRGLSEFEAARVGNYCGARAVEVVGVPSLDARELERLIPR